MLLRSESYSYHEYIIKVCLRINDIEACAHFATDNSERVVIFSYKEIFGCLQNVG